MSEVRSWNFPGAAWGKPDPDNPDYYSALVSSLAERAEMAVHLGVTTSETATKIPRPGDQHNIRKSFDFEAWDSAFDAVCRLYSDHTKPVLEQLERWRERLHKNTPMVGSGYDLMYAFEGYTGGGISFCPEKWTFGKIGTHLGWSDSDFMCPETRGWASANAEHVSRWLKCRYDAINLLRDLWPCEALAVRATLGGELEVTRRYRHKLNTGSTYDRGGSLYHCTGTAGCGTEDRDEETKGPGTIIKKWTAHMRYTWKALLGDSRCGEGKPDGKLLMSSVGDAHPSRSTGDSYAGKGSFDMTVYEKGGGRARWSLFGGYDDVKDELDINYCLVEFDYDPERPENPEVTSVAVDRGLEDIAVNLVGDSSEVQPFWGYAYGCQNLWGFGEKRKPTNSAIPAPPVIKEEHLECSGPPGFCFVPGLVKNEWFEASRSYEEVIGPPSLPEHPTKEQIEANWRSCLRVFGKRKAFEYLPFKYQA